jgi:predicted Zn finger-like uncharacterized protein
MAIEVSCPHCLAVYHLRDDMEGKTVRCKKCENPFDARPAGKAGTTGGTKPPAPRTDQVQPTRADGTRGKALRDKDDDRPRRRRYDDDDDDDAYAPPPPKKRSVLPWVLGGVGLALVVLLLGCGGLVYLVFSAGGDAINDAIADGQDPGQPPANLNQALAWARNENGFRRHAALDWLAQTNPEEGRRAEVVQALEPMLNGQDADGAGKALAHWSTREQVPTLLRMLNSQSGGVRTAAMEALGNLKDERAAAPLAARLPNFFDRATAGRALEALGPAAEKEVLKCAFHQDHGCRDEARRLLHLWGTRDGDLVAHAAEALKAPDAGARKGAAEWLLTAPIDPQRAPEIVQALEPMLNDSDHFAREPAGKALCRWATKDNVPALIKCLDNDSREVRKAAATALGNFKDERAAPALARQLTRVFEAKDYGQALEALGPALAEKEVVKYYFDNDHGAQEEARRLARAFGTKPEVIAEQAARDLKNADDRHQTDICKWLTENPPTDEKRRAEVGPALDPALRSTNRWTKEAALKAAIQWGSKDNVPALLGVLGDTGFGNADFRLLAIQALGKIKDDRAAATLTVSLLIPAEREQAAAALIAIGPGAEKPVLTGLKSADPVARALACRILKTIGTKESLKDLETCAAKDRVPGVKAEAKDALAAIKDREK